MRPPAFLGTAGCACLIILMGACTGTEDKDEAEVQEDLSTSLQRNRDGLDEETADCYAEAIIEELGMDVLREVDLSDDEPEAGLDEDIAAAASRADDRCRSTASGG